MAETVHPAEHAAHDEHHDEGWVKKYLFSTDHKIIAMQYLITGMAMAAIGGFMAAKDALLMPTAPQPATPPGPPAGSSSGTASPSGCPIGARFGRNGDAKYHAE